MFSLQYNHLWLGLVRLECIICTEQVHFYTAKVEGLLVLVPDNKFENPDFAHPYKKTPRIVNVSIWKKTPEGRNAFFYTLGH